MGRLQPEFLDRVEAFADRVVDVATALRLAGVPQRICDQLMACGSSVGANSFEADEAMSRKDFARCLAIALKEVNETRFWLRLSGRRAWVKPDRLGPLLAEADELRRVFGAIVHRCRMAPSVSDPG